MTTLPGWHAARARKLTDLVRTARVHVCAGCETGHEPSVIARSHVQCLRLRASAVERGEEGVGVNLCEREVEDEMQRVGLGEEDSQVEDGPKGGDGTGLDRGANKLGDQVVRGSDTRLVGMLEELQKRKQSMSDQTHKVPNQRGGDGYVTDDGGHQPDDDGRTEFLELGE